MEHVKYCNVSLMFFFTAPVALLGATFFAAEVTLFFYRLGILVYIVQTKLELILSTFTKSFSR